LEKYFIHFKPKLLLIMIDPASLALQKASTALVGAQAKKGIAALLAPVGSLLIAALPTAVKEQYLNGKLTVRELATREDIFKKLTTVIADQLKNRFEKIEKARTPMAICKLQDEIESLEKKLLYISTIKMTLSGLKQKPEGALGLGLKDSETSGSQKQTSPTWFDMFKEIAERRSEPWRRELLSEAAKVEIESPDSVSLKTLWNLSLLDDHIFKMFTAFLESATYIDGYPVVMPEDDTVLIHAVLESEENGRTTLILALTALMEHGLVSSADFQVSSSDLIHGLTATRNFQLKHNFPKQNESDLPYLTFSGYHCTDLGLDIARLCSTPNLNAYSELGLDALISLYKAGGEVEVLVDNLT
jgi:Protein of unknown function (DUF2806)